jgi:hypothetical protein
MADDKKVDEVVKGSDPQTEALEEEPVQEITAYEAELRKVVGRFLGETNQLASLIGVPVQHVLEDADKWIMLVLGEVEEVKK